MEDRQSRNNVYVFGVPKEGKQNNRTNFLNYNPRKLSEKKKREKISLIYTLKGLTRYLGTLTQNDQV